jgi:hypothetical protein
MVCCYAEEMCDARCYLVEEGLLRFLQGWFGEEFEVLYTIKISDILARGIKEGAILEWFVELLISAENR